ncbi:hypothetical protein HOY82DRAFT_617720 [Tuber indicum]|nr:hypothetical protein HOY82DRAFT_617720 [Tuber indicum]
MDAVEMHCDSDADAEEACEPPGRLGRLPEEYASPPANLDDPLFRRVTQIYFTVRHFQPIDEDRVDVVAAHAAAQGDQGAQTKITPNHHDREGHRNGGPIPLSAIRRAWEPRKAKQLAEVDPA